MFDKILVSFFTVCLLLFPKVTRWRRSCRYTVELAIEGRLALVKNPVEPCVLVFLGKMFFADFLIDIAGSCVGLKTKV